MTASLDTVIRQLMDRPENGWSVGTFGAVGEFIFDPGEAVETREDGQSYQIVSSRGGMRVTPRADLKAIAFDTLSSDGETWGQSVAFCLPVEDELKQGVVRCLGPDAEALRPQDRDAILYDMGVGLGHVRMCARTRDADLIAALDALEGKPILSAEGSTAAALVLKTSPHRVMLSPIARLEVYAAIPAPGGQSPAGPHTHLLPKLIATGRTHGANAPIPDGLQPVLNVGPRSPWRDSMGKRVEFDASLDKAFVSLLEQFALPEDRAVKSAVEAAVAAGTAPEAFPWPSTRRGRAAARITLRRLARTGENRSLSAWRKLYDRLEDQEADEAAALLN